jgi:hypothetical protein
MLRQPEEDMMKARWVLNSAIVLGLSMGFTQARATPGDLVGSDPFRLTFDEFGNGFFQIVQPNGSLGPAVNDPGTVVGGFLQYMLPEPVVLGDVAITSTEPNGVISEPCNNASDCSDGLRFVQTGSTFFMQYFSDPTTPNPADTGFPSNFSFSFKGATETGPEDVQETFLYTPGGNSYSGVSDGRLAVPEPASIALFGTALIGFGAALRRRRR